MKMNLHKINKLLVELKQKINENSDFARFRVENTFGLA